MTGTDNTRALARSIAESITVTTPGRVTWHTLRHRKAAPVVVALAWLPVIAVIALGACALIVR